MLELKEKVKFSVGPLGINEILEGINNLFNGNDFLISLLLCLIDYTVGTFPNLLNDIELLIDPKFKLF